MTEKLTRQQRQNSFMAAGSQYNEAAEYGEIKRVFMKPGEGPMIKTTQRMTSYDGKGNFVRRVPTEQRHRGITSELFEGK